MSVGFSFGSITLGAKTNVSSKIDAIMSEIRAAFQKDLQSKSPASQTGTATTGNIGGIVNDYILKLDAAYETAITDSKNTVKTLSDDREATIKKIKEKHDQKEKAEKHTKDLLLSLALIKAPKLRGTTMEELNEFAKQKREYNKKYTKALTKIVPLKMINDQVTKDIEKFEAELSLIDKKILEEYEIEKQMKAEKEKAEADAIAMAKAIEKAKAQEEAQAKAKAEEEALALAMSTSATTTSAATTTTTTSTTGSSLSISA